MEIVRDFFALRPIFTTTGLKIVWIAFLLYEAWIFYGSVSGIYAAGRYARDSQTEQVASVLLTLLPIAFNVIWLRVLLEVADAIIRQAPTPPADSD